MIKWFKSFFRKKAAVGENELVEEPADQAVIIHIFAEDVQTEDPVADLAVIEDELQELLKDSGEVDGHDIGSEDANVYIYGPSAEAIFAITRPFLIAGELTDRARVTLRFGPPDSPERTVQLPEERYAQFSPSAS